MNRNKLSDRQLREVRIELLRARAAVERKTLGHGVRMLGQELQPSALLRSIWPSSKGRASTGILTNSLGLLKQYPFLLSMASALFSGTRKKSRLLRLGSGLLLGWQLVRRLGNRRGRPRPPELISR